MAGLEEIVPLRTYSNDDDDYQSFLDNPEVYFETLKKMTKVAEKIRLKEEDEEKKLVEFLPLNERFTLDKENKVLTRWQERQKEWEKIESLIKKKLTARKGVNRPLMMTTTDEYRAKLEEYDLIQAAMPLKDRYSDSAWQMSLRGGGPIIVNIGHIFSGLECKIEPKLIVPKMVRKPKPTTAIWKNDTFIEPTENYLTKVKKYEKTLQTIRPHNLTYQEAGSITISTMNLFQWAKESSEQFMLQEKEKTMLTSAEELEIAEEDDEYLKEIANAASSILASHKHDPEHTPKLEFLSSPEVIFEITHPNQQTAAQTVTFKNVSKITLYYRWKKLEIPMMTSTDVTPSSGNVSNSISRFPSASLSRSAANSPKHSAKRIPSVDALSKRTASVNTLLTTNTNATAGGKNKKQFVKSLYQTFNEKSSDLEPMRSRILAQERESFHILNPCGEILPGETVSTQFIFTNRTGNSGMYKSNWLLQLLPEECQITLPNDPAQGSSSSDSPSHSSAIVKKDKKKKGKDKKSRKKGGKGDADEEDEDKHKVKTYHGSIPVHCKGIITFPDESMTRRQQIQLQLDQSMTETIMKDILYDVLRHIRQPIRLKDLQQRKIEYFAKINQDLLLHTFQDRSKENMKVPFTITIDRVENIEKLSYQVENTIQSIVQYYHSLLQSPEVQEAGSSIFTPLSYDFNYPFQDFNRKEILQTLFPEEQLEIFDEVSFEEILPHWDYSMNTPLQALQNLQPVLTEIEKLEVFIAQVQKQKEKERLKEERRAKRKADGDDDEEDEEDEEEEEPEEEDEDAKKRKPKHSLIIETNDLQYAVLSELHKLVSYDLPSQSIYEITKNAVSEAIDSIFAAQEEAFAEAGIAEIINNGGKVTPVESPYSSEIGKTQWETIMNTTSASSEPVDPKKKEKPPPKNAPPPTTLTNQQCDFYHKLFYEKLRNRLMDSLASSVVQSSYPTIQQYVENTYYTAAQNKQLNALSLTEIATWRPEDVKNQFLLFSSPTKLLTPNPNLPYPASAYPIYEESIAKEFVQVLSNHPRGIILTQEIVNESLQEEKSLYSFEKQYESLKQLITTHYDKWIELDKKQRKKAKIKEEKLYPTLHIIYFKTMGEFYYYFNNLSQYGQYTSPTHNNAQISVANYFSKFIPIFFLENLQYYDVIPVPPEYQAVDSDDDEVAISIGKEEHQQRIKQKWLNSRPHRVNCEIVLNNPTIPKLSPKEVTVNASKRFTQPVLADPIAALEELYYLLVNTQKKLQSSEEERRSDGEGVLYVEDNPQALFNDFSSFYRISMKQYNKKVKVFQPVRYTSHSLREGIIWCSLLQMLPQFPSLVKPLLENLPPTEDNNGSSVADPNTPAGIANHISRIFPTVVQEHASSPSSRFLRSLFVLGGELRMDKFRVLDELLTLVDTIYLVGEMALPFIVLFSEARFPNLDDRASQYFAVARLLVAKARLTGCALYYPQDIQLAEDELKAEEKLKCYQNIVLDSRSDGAEYEGDVKNTSIIGSFPPKTEFYGYYYDIGNETIKHFQSITDSYDFIVVWGTSGVTEINSFQTSQQAIIQAVTVKPTEDKALMHLPPKRHTILWGDSTVEWFARFIDSDGEMAGNLVGAGFVSYQNRDSTLLRCMIGHYSSEPLVKSTAYREAKENEWIYSTRIIEVEEEEEEEEEDDE